MISVPRKKTVDRCGECGQFLDHGNHEGRPECHDFRPDRRITRRKPGRKGFWLMQVAEKGRDIGIAIEPLCLAIKLNKTRQVMRLPWGRIYLWAARVEEEAERDRKRKARRELGRIATSIRRGALLGRR